MSKIVGIDFGTSTSEAALLEDGHPVVISNQYGEKITPSAVGLAEDGSLLVGRDARDQFLLRPEETLLEIKRLMGSAEKVSLGDQNYTPAEIAAKIIKYLKECSEKHLGAAIDRAVITVPAYFTDKQRRATVEAGGLAGLKVERIINEPTAAALAYGIEHMEENQHILVYDLGGGTFDVTVLEMFQGVLEVKASSGNNQLGGKEFDQRLADYLLDNFRKAQGKDLVLGQRALARLKEAVELCKIALSSAKEYHIVLPFIAEKDGAPLALEYLVTREIFEDLIADLVESTKKHLDIALGDAGLAKKDLDLILAVGGSTRIPLVQRFLQKELGQKPQTPVDPELAVVMGAAIQGGIINQELSEEKDILITDVCPYTLGIETMSFLYDTPIFDLYSTIIPRNTTIPVSKEEIYYTSTDNQEKVEINVFQGDNPKASLNNLLGTFILDGVPPAPVSEERIKVRFTYDINGILQVAAIVVSTGKQAGITIETTGVRKMEDEPDLTNWHKAPGARKYRGLLRRAEKILAREDDPFVCQELESQIKNFKKNLLLQQDKEILQDLEGEMVDLLYDLEDEK